jgi:hypothetical protein
MSEDTKQHTPMMAHHGALTQLVFGDLHNARFPKGY